MDYIFKSRTLLDELLEMGYTHEIILDHFIHYFSEDALVEALDQFYIDYDIDYFKNMK